MLLDWDNFVRITIQSWEEFYLDWLIEGKDIMMVYYEKLKIDQLDSTLMDIASFLNHTIENKRLDCFIKHSRDFERVENCIVTSEKERRNFKNKYIYSKKHITWINSAIRAVSIEAKTRGFDSVHLLSYQNTNLKLKYCSM